MKKYVIYKLLFVVVLCVIDAVSLENCLNLPVCTKSENTNKEFMTNILGIYVTVESIHKCARNCRQFDDCMAFSYHRIDERCSLHSVNTSMADPTDVVEVSGSVFTDINPWFPTNCDANNCTSDEKCHVTTTSFICKKNDGQYYKLCHAQTTSMNCFRMYSDSDLPSYDTRTDITKPNLEECIIYCNKHHPAYKTILYATLTTRCFCKTISVWDFLKNGGTLKTVTGAHVYDRLYKG